MEFYKQRVRLPEDEQSRLATARDTCSNAVVHGLDEKEELAPERFVEQGSFAMRTVVQHPEFEYDIDCGILFSKEKIVGSRGGDKTPRDAREMIAAAFDDKRFAKKPEVKKNCVRFHYQDGYHVDMPVYRRVTDFLGGKHHEIASGDEWKRSDPEAVTKWFNNGVQAKSPDMKVDGQMRRLTCLLKAVEKTREYYNWPSGFIVSVLVYDAYVSNTRDDVAFVNMVRRIVLRLKSSQRVPHPIISEYLAEDNNAKVRWMRDKLEEFDAKFALLEKDCARGEAMKIWDQIFGVDFFTKRITEKAALLGFGSGAFTSPFTRPKDAGRWGDE